MTSIDYRGNRQYISVGNTARDARVALIFVDYPNRARVKVVAHAEVIDNADPRWAKLRDDNYGARVERRILLHVEGFDWNCPQHITPRFTRAEIEHSYWKRTAMRFSGKPQTSLASR